MSRVEGIRDAIRKLTSEQQARLMTEVGPDLCRLVMGRPALMMEMMPKCQEMIRDPEVMKAIRPIMERMMQGTTPEGPWLKST